MRFLALDKLINLEDGYRKRFKIDSLELILAKEGNEFFAFGAVCPHQEPVSYTHLTLPTTPYV